MSERDPLYDPVKLLTEATEAETETADELSALNAFHEVVGELSAETQTRDSIIKHSASTAKLHPGILEQLQSRADDCANNIRRLNDQLQSMSRSKVLEPVVWRAYEKVKEEAVALFRDQEAERFERQIQQTREEYTQRRQCRLQTHPAAPYSYEESYESYKNSLLRSQYFIEQLNQHYKDTVHGEKDFIDKNGVLGKIGLLSAICGLCFGFFFSFGETNNIWSIIIRCALAIGGIVCFFFAMSIASDYKKASGKSNFYSFVCNRYIADHIRKDRQKETDSLLRDMLKKMDSTDFSERYEQLSRYDRFEKDILEDYHFSKAIHEHIK